WSDNNGTEKDVMVYRICQELINNTVKHAQASEVRIELHQKNQSYSLQYADNGIGLKTEANTSDSGGAGQGNIESRLDQIQGELEVWSEPNQGVKYTIQWEQ
ncbi:MAG: hypothetical protein HRT74_14020, partial [Flavobacteriales bacterium]|nr:hypothetical protein [Flavobacteriales bacterium]